MLSTRDEAKLDRQWDDARRAALVELAEQTLTETRRFREMANEWEWAHAAAPLITNLFRAVSAKDQRAILTAASRLHVHAMSFALGHCEDEAERQANAIMRGDEPCAHPF